MVIIGPPGFTRDALVAELSVELPGAVLELVPIISKVEEF